MIFKVSKILGQAEFDSLPAAKITTYPKEEKDYKPFAQCALCLSEDTLYLRMWAFEVTAMPTSSLRAEFFIFRDKPDIPLAVAIVSDGGVVAKVGDAEFDVAAKPHIGEDLQGVYWGATIQIPFSKLEKIGGKLLCEVDHEFLGNFYKTCSDEPFVHEGCFFPEDSGGRFLVVGY